MGTVDVASMLLLLVAVATAVVIYVVLYTRKRQLTQGRLEEEKRQAQRGMEEERHRRETEEVQRKAEEERQRREAEEAQRKAEEECQRREAEEAQRKTEEDRQRHAAEEARRKAEERRIPLEKRGGRPPGPAQVQEKPATQETKPRCPKPEVVCWKRERRWILLAEVPEDLLGNPDLAVTQNASHLVQDESREECWRLVQARGQVVIQWDEDGVTRENDIALGEENHLLFKLSGPDQNQGRRVRSVSSGSYLVVAPESWERDEKLSGSPSASPEPVSVEGYRGHFFDLEKGSDKRIAFRTSEGKPIQIESKTARFDLVGTQLSDGSEDVGPLFGKSLPRIRALHDQSWTDIGTIVVGEEGSRKGRWRKSFSPAPEKKEQDLPPEVAARKGGWYFLRFYDTNDDLVESLDFRLVCALREIKVFKPSPFPSEGEHEAVYVEFRHEPGCAIQPADALARSVQTESKNNQTILTIPPEPTCDETRWLVGPEGKLQVQVAILVERLWWAVGAEDNPPSAWGDKLLTLACDDFIAISKKALWLRLPKRRWTDRILVGFEQSKARPYAVKVAEKEIAIPLRDFGDCREMRERDQDHFWRVWIEHDGEPVEGIVAIIPASQQPVLCVERGKKRTAIATAVLREGTGVVKVNGQPIDDYFGGAPLKAKQFLWRLLELPRVRKVLSQMEVSITVTGSNPTTLRQAKASAHALARALMKHDTQLRPLLKQEGFGGARVTKAHKHGVRKVVP